MKLDEVFNKIENNSEIRRMSEGKKFPKKWRNHGWAIRNKPGVLVLICGVGFVSVEFRIKIINELLTPIIVIFTVTILSLLIHLCRSFGVFSED